jgi:hypothetical protein
MAYLTDNSIVLKKGARMDKLKKSPLIVILLTLFLCIGGALLDAITGRGSESLFAPIGMVIGIIIGFVILSQASEGGFFAVLNRWFNPYSKKRREYSAALRVACPERQAFNYCVSALRASGLRHELHHDLGTILALQPSRTFLGIPNFHVSFGVDVSVRVEPLESGYSLVAIRAESRRVWFGVWAASWAEKWNYETKEVVEGLFGLLMTILDRQGVEYGDYEVL